jgi:hypothetical protein
MTVRAARGDKPGSSVWVDRRHEERFRMFTRMRESARDLSWLALIPSAVMHRVRGTGRSETSVPPAHGGETRETGTDAGSGLLPFPHQRKRSDERERHIV